MHRGVRYGRKRVEGRTMFADEDRQTVIFAIVFVPAESTVAALGEAAHLNCNLAPIACWVDAAEGQSRGQAERRYETGEKVSRLDKRIAQVGRTGLLA